MQQASLPPALEGADLVCKAKTGTGKTLAFLIPAFERILASPSGPGKIGVLVISPTRELASQIAVEAGALATLHGFVVQTVVGGTNLSTDLSRLNNRTPTVLVATPGRLNDLLQNGGAAPKFSALRVLIFDEADRLLDMGFRPAIDTMLRALPAMVRTAASSEAAVRSGSFAFTISSSCLRVTLPTFSVFGRLEPEVMPTAFLSSTVAGVLLVTKVKVRSE